MIIIPFIPGTFGTTVEYMLKKFTLEGQTVDLPLLSPKPDGSMHNFSKENHIIESDKLAEQLELAKDQILTPIYPFKKLHTKETFDVLNNVDSDITTVTICITDFEMAEVNLLFQYHKIAIRLNYGLDVFFNREYTEHNLTSWATDWDNIQDWEKREWFSIYYPGLVNTEWLSAINYINPRALVVTNTEILVDTANTFDKIISFCDRTKIDHDRFDKFVTEWRNKQQYILDEYAAIKQFVESTINNTDYELTHSSLISEAIIQQKLRERGYEIRCWNLNIFPTQAQDLHKLLEQL